jgi:hypothetical protein
MAAQDDMVKRSVAFELAKHVKGIHLMYDRIAPSPPSLRPKRRKSIQVVGRVKEI